MTSLNFLDSLAYSILISLAILLPSCMTSSQIGQPTVQTPPQSPIAVTKPPAVVDTDALINPQASFELHLNSQTTPLVINQPLRLSLQSQVDSFVSLYHISSSGKTARLFNNQEIHANQVVAFPAPESMLDWVLRPPPGEETYILVATQTPQQWLAAADLATEGVLTLLALTPSQLIERLITATSRLHPASWNIAVLRLPLVNPH